MTETIKLSDGWLVRQTTFSPAETEAITGLPQSMLRLWRSRGYLSHPEKGRWSKNTVADVALVYLMNTLTRLGFSPSFAVACANSLVADLIFFGLISGDGACEFIGPKGMVIAMRNRFDDDFALARLVGRPTSEDRFVLVDADRGLHRCADLARVIEDEKFEHLSCIDLLVAGRRIVERAGRPLFTFDHKGQTDNVTPIRRLSHSR